MKKSRLVVAAIVLFGLGGITLYISYTLFAILFITSVFAYQLIRIEYEQYLREQKVIHKELEIQEAQYDEQLEVYRAKKYTKQWLENIW